MDVHVPMFDADNGYGYPIGLKFLPIPDAGHFSYLSGDVERPRAHICLQGFLVFGSNTRLTASVIAAIPIGMDQWGRSLLGNALML